MAEKRSLFDDEILSELEERQRQMDQGKGFEIRGPISREAIQRAVDAQRGKKT